MFNYSPNPAQVIAEDFLRRALFLDSSFEHPIYSPAAMRDFVNAIATDAEAFYDSLATNKDTQRVLAFATYLNFGNLSAQSDRIARRVSSVLCDNSVSAKVYPDLLKCLCLLIMNGSNQSLVEEVLGVLDLAGVVLRRSHESPAVRTGHEPFDKQKFIEEIIAMPYSNYPENEMNKFDLLKEAIGKDFGSEYSESSVQLRAQSDNRRCDINLPEHLSPAFLWMFSETIRSFLESRRLLFTSSTKNAFRELKVVLKNPTVTSVLSSRAAFELLLPNPFVADFSFDGVTTEDVNWILQELEQRITGLAQSALKQNRARFGLTD